MDDASGNEIGAAAPSRVGEPPDVDQAVFPTRLLPGDPTIQPVSIVILLLVAQVAAHGYEVVQRLEYVGIVVNHRGSVYHRLKALERAGLLASAWEMREPGPARRVYRITALGTEYVGRCHVTAYDPDPMCLH